MCRFMNKLGRKNYVTPTSYLELIGSFKDLITAKQTSVMKQKTRYVTGLEKLAFAASQVDIFYNAMNKTIWNQTATK